MRPVLRISLLLWTALAVSTLGYVGVLFVLEPPAAQPNPSVLPMLGATAFAFAFASILVPRQLLRGALSRLSLEIREEPDPSEVQYRDRIPMRRLFADPEGARQAAIQVHATPFIIGMALAEVVAVMGLVLGLLGFPRTGSIAFFAASWALMAWHFPRLSAIDRALESAQDAKLPAD